MYKHKFLISLIVFTTVSVFSQTDSTNSNLDSLKIFNWNFHRVTPDFVRKLKSDSIKNKIIYLNDFKLIDNSKLKKNGMIYRGVNVSTNNDLSLQSGFKLNLSGKISDELFLNAALSDQNLNLPTKSSTQKINEIDNIFINLKGEYFSSTIGDIVLKKSFDENHQIKKISGLNLNLKSQIINNINFSVGTSKGKFLSQTINAIDNLQGPYKIYGNNNERNILIISGSESVYLNGKVLKKGQTNDYLIDYTTGEITFTFKNLITKHSRITIDFEYSENNYQTNYYDFGVSENLIDDKISFRAEYLNESDDEINKVESNLTDSDIELLKKSKSSTVYKSAVFYVGVDSLTLKGKGSYYKTDTLISNWFIPFYKYLPNGDKSFYNINFSFVGFGKGNYRRINYGFYEFTGIGKGDYDTLITLNAPKNNSILSISTGIKLTENSKINIDLNLNKYLKNKYFDEADYFKQIFYKISHTENLFYDYLVNIDYNGKYLDDNFKSLNRTVLVERNRDWGIDSTFKQILNYQNEQNVNLNIANSNFMLLDYNFGLLNLSNSSNSKRNVIKLKLFDSTKTIAEIKNENIVLKDELFNTNNNWNRFNFNGIKNFSFSTIQFEVNNELREIKKRDSTENLQFGSFSFDEYKINVFLHNKINGNIKLSYENRIDKKPVLNTFIRFYESKIFAIESDINFNSNQSGKFIFKKRESVNLVNKINEVSNVLHSNYSGRFKNYDLNILEELSNEYSPMKEKLFYEVNKGYGSYIWVDGNKNGIVDFNLEEDFILNKYEGNYNSTLITTDKYEKLFSNNSVVRLNISNNAIKSIYDFNNLIINNLSMNYFLKNEVKSKSFNFENILKNNLNNNEIVNANIFYQQDYFLFENNPEFNLRFRIVNKKNKYSIISGVEKNYYDELNFRIKYLNLKEEKHQIELLNTQNSTETYITVKNKNIESNKILYDYSEQISKSFEYGFEISYLLGSFKYLGNEYKIENNTESFRVTNFIDLKSQFRINYKREENLLSNIFGIPAIQIYEITNGKNVGISHSIEMFYETILWESFNFQLQYSIRREENKKNYQNFIANIKAFF